MVDYKKVFDILGEDHQQTMLEMDFTPWQILVATILSSRTKDSTTIPLVRSLFKKYPLPQDLLKIKEKDLFGVGFYKVKTQRIKELVKLTRGKVPTSFTELVKLPGVGRKTANCVLNYAFDQPAVAVDIHVHRISNRLGWVKTKTPEETEAELMKILPQKLWSKVNMLLVNHGQTTCKPLNPNCSSCKIKKYCDYGNRV